jgi:hypothetical protein
MEKKKQNIPNRPEQPKDKDEKEISLDPTVIENGYPTQLETREKDQYREEHGDLTNDHT